MRIPCRNPHRDREARVLIIARAKKYLVSWIILFEEALKTTLKLWFRTVQGLEKANGRGKFAGRRRSAPVGKLQRPPHHENRIDSRCTKSQQSENQQNMHHAST